MQRVVKAHFTKKKTLLQRLYYRYNFTVFGEQQESQDCTYVIKVASGRVSQEVEMQEIYWGKCL